MASVKAIEGRSVHQIQSGQVIVDLCSVVKELVENSLDAGATYLDVRFKNQGLEAIEVQDNGAGISPHDYETIGLKHYTSKLSTYQDLSSLDTFGFRGEALSSLCALSNLHIVTARDGEAPKGTRLDFETSGKLKGATVAASPKGTTVSAQALFNSLPVRRRELEKNIKREYSKVIGVLNAYACVSTKLKFSVSNQPAKGKKLAVFSTRNNSTTRENIADVYGAKAVSALTPLDLELEIQPTVPSQGISDIPGPYSTKGRRILLEGHVSRPVHGEGRQTPDRQMFFVNSRPCSLPQVAKAFNEVYRSYNISQSPFVFANFKMDTTAYDVNVSPDKRTIMLHDQGALLETMKSKLIAMFETQDQTIPVGSLSSQKLPAFKPPIVSRNTSDSLHELPPLRSALLKEDSHAPLSSNVTVDSSGSLSQSADPTNLVSKFAERDADERPANVTTPKAGIKELSEDKQRLARKFERQSLGDGSVDVAATGEQSNHRPVASQNDDLQSIEESHSRQEGKDVPAHHLHTYPNWTPKSHSHIDGPRSSPGPDQESNRPRMLSNAAFTPSSASSNRQALNSTPGLNAKMLLRAEPSANKRIKTFKPQSPSFAQGLRAFAAPGAQCNTEAEGSQLDVQSQDTTSDQGRDSTDCESASSTKQDLSADDRPEISDASDAHSDTFEDGESDGDYLGEEQKKEVEEGRVQDMVKKAEQSAVRPSQIQQLRSSNILSSNKESPLSLVRSLNTSVEEIKRQANRLNQEMQKHIQRHRNLSESQDDQPSLSKASAEEKLTLKISKSDFASMRVVGQFNLGFILAVRSPTLTGEPSSSSHPTPKANHTSDDLFIIDQHASDEIYNFSRLSLNTTLTPQPLVRPHLLHLTAIEEETIMTHKDHSLVKNGFTIHVDQSGDSPVGERCKLLTLPTSRETIFDTRDLEELLSLLADALPPNPDEPSHLTSTAQPDGLLNLHNTGTVRPSKVRRMLAMRACRSSIMVGKTLTQGAMERVVRHMGEIERPWNCPHGRPTMRHLTGLGELGGWVEDLIDGEDDGVDAGPHEGRARAADWRGYLERWRGERGGAGVGPGFDECGGEVGGIASAARDDEMGDADAGSGSDEDLEGSGSE